MQYRNADAWDMQYAQPVLYRTTPCTKFRMIEIAEGNHPSVPNLKMPVNLGMDFIHTQNGDHFIYNRNLFESIISIYGPVNEMSDFMISGEMIPSRETDSELIYTFKEINS
ncbi:TPA: AraC family transcriptional regulator, partial [Escherichia coli]